MRIAIGQLWQETNTFNPTLTTRQDFEEFGILRGKDLVDRMGDTNELGGFIQSLRAWPEKPEIVGLVRLPAWPSGTATAETFEWIRREVLDSLEKARPVDAVLLALHGAMVSAKEPDVEGAILEAVRQRIGSKIPLVATLDLHTNITQKMVANADALVLYHTAPHIDVFETGQRGAALLRRILIDGAKPTTAFQKLPMVVPAENANTQERSSVSFGLREEVQGLEHLPGVLTAGIATVQPWLDIPELGSAVLVTTDNDPQEAQRMCAEVAAMLWHRRRDYFGELVTAADAVRTAFELHGEGLIVLSDCADATTSGAPGDSNWVLAELVKYAWSRPALVTLVAPDVVAAAQKLGVGGTHPGPLGGVRDHRFSKPLPLTTTVERLFEARFILSGHLAKNLPIDMGPSVVLRHGAVRIIVTSRSGPHFAPQLFEAAGFDPFTAGVLIAKSPCGFRAAYQPRARKILVVSAPGCAPPDFWKYEFKNIPRPLWPWDEIEWKATELDRSGPRIHRCQRHALWGSPA
ncbi:MAG: M81 family metallopeptidase [Planctomycetes bacterium]|nr:M81 family metallopeptidase [Planctomycetota bacterium]